MKPSDEQIIIFYHHLLINLFLFLNFSEKKITEEMEQECIKANISVYNNLAACILANVKDNSTSNAEKEHEKVVKYTGMV